jgi:uncharacterized protein YecE (DUF72 family)
MIRLGTAGWSIPSALRPRFPAVGSQLERYAARMNAAEINTSFYRPHRRETYERWAASVPADFRFSVKLPRVITHEAGLRDFATPLWRFLEEIAGLADKLGVILVQLPPKLVFDRQVARRFFTALCESAPCAIACEPRHASWFAEEADTLLIRHGIARVAADPPRHAADGMPGGASSLAYWRWHGAPRIYWSAYDDERLRALAAAMLRTPAQEHWCIFDNTASGAALDDAARLATMLRTPIGSLAIGTKSDGAPYNAAKQEDPMARKYSKGASKKVERAMHEMKRGELKSGRSKKKVKSRKQAIAIGLSEARAAGKKVPKKRTGGKKKARKTTKKKASSRSRKKKSS